MYIWTWNSLEIDFVRVFFTAGWTKMSSESNRGWTAAIRTFAANISAQKDVFGQIQMAGKDMYNFVHIPPYHNSTQDQLEKHWYSWLAILYSSVGDQIHKIIHNICFKLFALFKEVCHEIFDL